MAEVAEIGVLGGSGLYALLEDARTVEVQTPYGAPSAPVVVGAVGGRSVAFLPRHGRSHEHPPHRIPYRANLWALRSLGVRQVLAPCAVGGLRPELGPGSLVVVLHLGPCSQDAGEQERLSRLWTAGAACRPVVRPALGSPS